MKLLSLTSRFRKSAKCDEIPKIPRSINSRNINYMGKFRLKKILYNYILCQYGKEMFIDFAAAVQECETAEQFYIKQEEHKKSKMGSFYLYTNGYPAVNDWIICYHNKYYFTVETCCGIERIRVTISIVGLMVFFIATLFSLGMTKTLFRFRARRNFSEI